MVYRTGLIRKLEFRERLKKGKARSCVPYKDKLSKLPQNEQHLPFCLGALQSPLRVPYSDTGQLCLPEYPGANPARGENPKTDGWCDAGILRGTLQRWNDKCHSPRGGQMQHLAHGPESGMPCSKGSMSMHGPFSQLNRFWCCLQMFSDTITWHPGCQLPTVKSSARRSMAVHLLARTLARNLKVFANHRYKAIWQQQDAQLLNQLNFD